MEGLKSPVGSQHNSGSGGIPETALEDGLLDLGVPVQVQIFLWRQIAPFIRPKLGKLHEASCMFCQHAPGHHELKEACKSFEKVLVQNIQFGLSPSLTSALQSIPRWRLVQSALPHVMHCAAALLHNRVKDLQSLGQAETKLLYTLHWILLFASDECSDTENGEDGGSTAAPAKNNPNYLFSVPAISLFVYLFAPIAHHLKESDFKNYRLENGLRLWQGMWEFRSPGAPCFIAPVKPRARRMILLPQSPKASLSPDMQDNHSIRKHSNADSTHSNTTFSTDTPKHDDDWLGSPKDCNFPETIPEEASSIEEERVVIFRIPTASNGQETFMESYYTMDASLLQHQTHGDHPILAKRHQAPTKFDFDKIESFEKEQRSRSDNYTQEKKQSSTEEEQNKTTQIVLKYDVNAATFMDVGVLRCLFMAHWQEEGVYWSLHYFNNRLREISEESAIPPPQPRKRSNSLPIPQIEISLYQGPTQSSNNSRDSPSGNSAKDYMDLPEKQPAAAKDDQGAGASPTTQRRSSEKKRRVKMADIARAFVETKMFSKSDRTLENVGLSEVKQHIEKHVTNTSPPSTSDGIEYHRSLDTTDHQLSRSASMINRTSSTNLVKGKSMPSLRFYRSVEPQHKSSKPSSLCGSAAGTSSVAPPPKPATIYTRNPIITVTEHTPTPSPDYLRRQGSIDSQLDVLSQMGCCGKVHMLRSQTDSHIAYSGADEIEAPGSSFYITPEGGIDLEVLLLAVYSVFKKDSNICSLRVLETGLNISELLLDLGVMKLSEHAHKLSMGITKRALLHLGCPHGCNDGIRGPPAEFLRTQCHTILSRMLRTAAPMSRNYLRDMVRTSPLHELVEFFHAFVGFCVDPSSLLSPLNHKRSTASKTLNASELGSTGGQGGYATNFGGGLSGGAESQVIAAVFKALVTRFVGAFKELKGNENIALYCDVRQLINYVKGAHGGPFRRTALSGIMAVTPRPNKKSPNLQTTRVIRHLQPGETQLFQSDEKSSRKILFKKRSTSSACPSLLETENGEDGPTRQSPISNLRRKTQNIRPTLTPRHSEKTLLSDSNSSSERLATGRFSGIVRWFKGSSTRDINTSSMDHVGVLGPELAATFMRHGSLKGRRGADGIGKSLQKAKRRVERRLGRFGKGKKKANGAEESTGNYFSRRSSYDVGDGARESEVVMLKERRLVPIEPVREGMLRFSFLLETCTPGSVPDPQLVAAVLDLPNAPLITRATFLLECAYFVHMCNRNQWPGWMRQNMSNSFRPNMSNQSRASVSSTNRRMHMMQRTAGKMFYQWAEFLGARLEEMIQTEKQSFETVTLIINDPEKQRRLLQQDEEEDFLDEACVNPNGNNCPHALKLIACVLLMEITTFLREMYQTLPKASKLAAKEKPAPWEKMYREANRRWSMALSSMGHSQTSAQSLQSIAGGEGQPERKISFVLHEPDNESEGSSSITTLTIQGEESGNQPNQRRPAAVRPFLLRRGTTAVSTGGSFKRRSLKLRRGTKEGKDFDEYAVKRTDSIQSRRKVSSLSDRSDTSDQGGEESPGILSDDQPPESPSDSNDTDETGKTMPWMKSILELMNSFNYYCSHQNYCHPYCYRRHMRAASRLLRSVRKIYGEEPDHIPTQEAPPTDNNTSRPTTRKERRNARKVSEQSSSQSSPKRKESIPRNNRINLEDVESGKNIPHATANNNPSGARPKTETSPILKYIRNHLREMFHVPMAALIKGAVILNEEQFVEGIPAAWELILEPNQEVSATAAAFFILASVKAPTCVSEIMQKALKNKEPQVRIGAILRYQILWKSRFQVWPRMEEGAHSTFKVPPPGIEFTLPSPKIGIESLPVVDPPWSPRQSKNMEMTLNQERHRSIVTSTKTRKKQQSDAIQQAIQLQEDKDRQERQCFMLTTIPITLQASHEPGLDHVAGEDHTEEEDNDGTRLAPHLHAAHSLFPSVLCSSVMQIVACLDDAAVCADGCAVYEIAYQVIWVCLVEDSALFLRYVLERLTRDRQDQMFKVLRHLIRFVPRLPQQAAFALYNYIIGYVMFYVRSSHEHSQQLVGSALSILWMVVHSVHGIMFKDLKQILRKEQCDASILLTANVPSAKKIIVHGPEDRDEGGIPSQFPVQEDTQFVQLLRESLDFFGIEEKDHASHFLIDYKTQQILNPICYVRDLYFFKRSQYPQLRLVQMKPDEAFGALQRQELWKKFVEIGKVHLTWAILKNVDMVVQRVVFLHEELMKLPSFPRKALESDLDLYKGGELGKELLGLDVLHKFMWVRLIARMFEAMAGNFAYSADIQLFLNVLSGACILHSEDSCILRYVTATFINAAFNFKNIFSTSGYFMIMPTLLQVYSLHQTNKLVTTTIEYAVKQFYLLNRKPFILQMFGSVSAILDTDEDDMYGEAHKVQSSCLFNLLLSLETPSPDPLNIAELVKETKPLKAIDFCYHDEDEMVTVLDCITLCVMVVSYSAESTRGYQMLVILEAILPCYIQQIQSPTYVPLLGKCERDIILQLAVAIRTLVHNCEGLSKSYNGPYRNSPEHKGSSQRNCSRGNAPCSPGLDFEDESHSKYVSDVGRTKKMMNESAEDSEMIRSEYRRPRDVLLSVVGEFISRAQQRLNELTRKQSADAKNMELLDLKCHIRLADIAHSLLKVSPYDPESMACRGLQRYMQFVLPRAEWDNDGMRPALVTIIRRLDKVFLKISKKPSIRRNTDWEAAAGLLKGIHETVLRYPYVLHWQQMKSLLTTIQNLIINEPGNSLEGVSSAGVALMSQNPPAFFCSTVVRVLSLQLVSSSVDSYSLEQLCGGGSEFSTQEKAERYLMHLLMPLCLKICSGRDIGDLKQTDITYLATAILNAMSPPSGRTAQTTGQANRGVGDLRASSLTFTGSRDAKRPARIAGSLYQAGFLALRLLCICFEQRMAHEWPKIVRVMRDLGRRNEAAPELWSFLEFTVNHRTPLYIVLMPFILHKISIHPIGDHERHMQFLIRERMRGMPPAGGIKSKGAVMLELARELKELREEIERRYGSDKDIPEPNASQNVSKNRESSSNNNNNSSSLKESAAESVAPVQPPPTAGGKQQRPSLISLFTGPHLGQSLHGHHSHSGDQHRTPSDTLSQNTLAPPRESLSSSSTTTNKEHGVASDSHSADGVTPTPSAMGSATHIHITTGSAPHLSHSMSLQTQNMKMPQQTPKLRFVSSVEFRHSSGETSTTPLSPESPAEDSSGDMHKHRLQRSKAQSRKTFRLRRGRGGHGEPGHLMHDVEQPLQGNPAGSWDSVSQTSSTSGYRENCTGFLSPDGSLNSAPPIGRSSSQHSLLQLFEAQDEDTLI